MPDGCWYGIYDIRYLFANQLRAIAILISFCLDFFIFQ